MLSYLKTLSAGPAGVWTATSRSADRRSPNWANQAAVCKKPCRTLYNTVYYKLRQVLQSAMDLLQIATELL